MIRRILGIVSFLLAALMTFGVSFSAANSAPLIDNPEDYLAGFWVTGEAPPNGQCAVPQPPDSLVFFDFDEPDDWMIFFSSFRSSIFGPISVEKTGETTLLLVEAGRNGSATQTSRVHVSSNDSFELAPDQAKSTLITFHRCECGKIRPATDAFDSPTPAFTC